MFELVSAASAAAALVGSCLKVSQYIDTFISRVRNVDTAVQVLRIEIESLSRVLGVGEYASL
jgi:hypothetical protein